MYDQHCDGGDPTWTILTSEEPTLACRIPQPGNLGLQRLLYRYRPLQPTEDGTVYRLTVLEMFEPQSGGPKTIQRIRQLLLSGDGSTDHYFESEDGFGSEQGDRIEPPDQPGYIIPHIIRLGFVDRFGGWTQELTIPNFPNGWGDSEFQVDPERFMIRLDCPEDVLPSQDPPVAKLSVEGVGSKDCIKALPTAVNVLYLNGRVRHMHNDQARGWSCIPAFFDPHANEQQYANNVFISGFNGKELTLAHELGHLLADKPEHESASLSHALMKDFGTIWNGSPLDSKRLYNGQYEWVTKILDNENLVHVF